MSYNLNSGYGQAFAQAPLGAGKVFHVCKSGTSLYEYLSEVLEPDPDGIDRLYGASSTAAGVALNAAMAACQDGRNDYIIVWPSSSNYTIATTVDMDIDDVHLCSAEAMGPGRRDVGASRSTMLAPASSTVALTYAANTINTEIAGLFIKGAQNTASIVSGANCYGANIHHNTVWNYGETTNGTYAIDFYTNGNCLYSRIHHNHLVTVGSATTFGAMIGMAPSSTSGQVCYNEVMVGDGSTLTVGILNQAYKGMTHGNHVSAIAGGAGATSTITRAIVIGGGSANGNFLNCASTEDVSPSGSTEGFVGNWSGATGGAAANQAD
jgi:hypothetical protein